MAQSIGKTRVRTESAPKIISIRDGEWSAKIVVDSAERGNGFVYPGETDWKQWVVKLLAESSGSAQRQFLKYSTSVEIFSDRVSKGTSGSIEVICKRNKGAGLFNRFRQSRARRNFRRGWLLLSAGIQTATPLAVIERTKPSREDWLIAQFVPDLMDLDRIAMLELPRMSRLDALKLKRVMIEQLAALFARFRAGNLHHRDMKASNIMISNANTPESAGLYVLDLDGLGAVSKWRSRQRWQPLMRLAASMIEYRSVTRADFARCLKRYLILTDGNDREWKNHFHRIGTEARNYSAASQLRKRGKIDGIA